MTYKLPNVTQIVEFERVSPSGAIRKYKVLPSAGNRMAVVLHLDPTPVENKWSNDLWQVNQFNSEDEFKARCGQEMFDLIAEVYDREIKPAIYQKLFNTLSQLPKALGELVSDEDKTHPFYILKAKLAFLDSVVKVHDKGNSIYSTITDEQLIDNKERIERDFRNTVTVNVAYYNQISVAVNEALTQWGSHEMIVLQFEVSNDAGRNKRRVDKTCKTAGARNFVATVDEFIRLANLSLSEERADTITSLMVATSMLTGAMEGFKLFEQG